jgi:type I restriction enzyme S subunit
MISANSLGSHYPIKQLGDVVEFLDHLRKPITASDREPGPYPYYGANGRQDSVVGYLFDEPLILLAEDGGFFGVPDKTIAYRVNGKCWVNNHAHVLRPQPTVDIGYLCRHLEQYDVRQFTSGSTRLKLNKAKAQLIPLAIPPLSEQKRIAAILDAADALRLKRRESIEQLDSLVQTTFLEMFGDPVTNPKGWEAVPEGGSEFGEIRELGMIANVIDCKHRTPVYTTEGYPVVRPRNVREEGLSLQDCACTTEAEFKDLTDGRTPKNGDIVYSRNATFGVASLVRTGERFAIGQDVCLIVPNEVNPAFLHYLLNSHFVRRQLGLAASGSTFKRINLKAIRKLKVLIPPVDRQSTFGSFVESVKQQKSRQKAHLAELDSLFACLQSRAFKGEPIP